MPVSLLLTFIRFHFSVSIRLKNLTIQKIPENLSVFTFHFVFLLCFFLYIIIFWPIDRFSFVSCMVKKLLLPLSASFFFNKKKGKEIQNMFRKLAINRGEETISSVKFSYWEMKQISLYFNII